METYRSMVRRERFAIGICKRSATRGLCVVSGRGSYPCSARAQGFQANGYHCSPRHLRSMSRMPLSMKRSTAERPLSAVEGVLRCAMVPHNERVDIMLSLEDEQNVWEVTCLWWLRDTVVAWGVTGSDGDVWETALHHFKGELGLGML